MRKVGNIFLCLAVGWSFVHASFEHVHNEANNHHSATEHAGHTIALHTHLPEAAGRQSALPEVRAHDAGEVHSTVFLPWTPKVSKFVLIAWVSNSAVDPLPPPPEADRLVFAQVIHSHDPPLPGSTGLRSPPA